MSFAITLTIVSAALLQAGALHGQIVRLVNPAGRALYVNDSNPNLPTFLNRPAPTTPRGSAQSSPRSSATLVTARILRANSATQQLPAISGAQLCPVHDMAGIFASSNRLDPRLISVAVHAESNGNPKAVSLKGEQGLMQSMPQIARDLGVTNSFDPSQNFDAGGRTVARSGGVPNIPETQSYVRCITDSHFGTNSIPLAAQPFETSRPIRPELDSQGRMVFTNE